MQLHVITFYELMVIVTIQSFQLKIIYLILSLQFLFLF